MIADQQVPKLRARRIGARAAAGHNETGIRLHQFLEHRPLGCGAAQAQYRLADGPYRFVGPRIGGVIAGGGQRHAVDLILAAHRVAEIPVHDFAQIRFAPAQRPQMHRGVAIVHGIIVPEEQPMPHHLPETLGSHPRHARRHNRVAVPEDVNLRMQLLRHRREVGRVFGIAAIAPITGRTKQHLRPIAPGEERAVNRIHQRRMTRAERRRAFRSPNGVIQTDGKPFHALILRPGVMLKKQLQILRAPERQRTRRSQLRMQRQTERDPALGAALNDAAEILLALVGHGLPPLVAPRLAGTGDIHRTVTVHQEIHPPAGQQGDFLQILFRGPRPAFHAAKTKAGSGRAVAVIRMRARQLRGQTHLVLVAVRHGRAIVFEFELMVEVREILEPGLESHLADGPVRVGQQTGRVLQPQVGQVTPPALSGDFAEQFRELAFA
ncbi:MAG: hypothetical protein BWX84_01669 [Verrucomicrobia bacterium ADurb.Bin118]|nr:MAG: hypothetical protein BWX84_01669 [Verrucomicrobia bacterium ADurb.Bin118]